jgi:hypothetical protein
MYRQLKFVKLPSNKRRCRAELRWRFAGVRMLSILAHESPRLRAFFLINLASAVHYHSI